VKQRGLLLSLLAALGGIPESNPYRPPVRVIDTEKRDAKRERRAVRLAARVQSVAPFATSSERTGLPDHEYKLTLLKVTRADWIERSFDILTHRADCGRCAAEAV